MELSIRNTTHSFLHKQGLIMLKNDLNSIANLLKPTTNISKNHIELVKSNYELLHEMENIYIQYASDPDKVENRCYFEKYEFIPDYGMKIRKVKCIQLPFVFSQHFHSPCTASNYIQTENKVIKLMCRSKLKLIKSLGYNIKKQGLTFNAMTLFLIHAENAIKLSENNNYKLNNQIIKELSYATHYLEDLCETHHSTNKIGLGPLSFLLRIKFLKNKKFKKLSNHSDFENYALKNKNKYIINSVKEFCKIKSLREEEKKFWESYAFYDNFFNGEYLKNRNKIDCFKQICHWNALYSNSFAAGICDFYENEDIQKYHDKVSWALSYNQTDWDKNIEQTLKLAQISVSVFLFNFLIYISAPELFNF